MYHHILLSTWYSDFLTTKDQKDNLLLAGEVLYCVIAALKRLLRMFWQGYFFTLAKDDF